MSDVLTAKAPGEIKGSTEIRNKRNRVLVPIGNTETIRNRLQMTEAAFSEAIGYSSGTYSDFKRGGKIVKVAALAAEALMRRQQMSGETSDEVFVLRVIKGAPTCIRVGELRTLKLDDIEYYLVPKALSDGQD